MWLCIHHPSSQKLGNWLLVPLCSSEVLRSSYITTQRRVFGFLWSGRSFSIQSAIIRFLVALHAPPSLVFDLLFRPASQPDLAILGRPDRRAMLGRGALIRCLGRLADGSTCRRLRRKGAATEQIGMPTGINSTRLVDVEMKCSVMSLNHYSLNNDMKFKPLTHSLSLVE